MNIKNKCDKILHNIFPMLVAMVVYLFIKETIYQIDKTPWLQALWWLLLPVSFIYITGILLFGRNQSKGKEPPKVVTIFIYACLSIFMIDFVIVYAWACSLILMDFMDWLLSKATAIDHKLGVALFLALSIFLYIFRFYCRFIYGLTEVFVGLYMINNNLPKIIPQDDAEWRIDKHVYVAILTAGVYLIIRGVEGVHLYYEKDKMLKIIVRFMKGLYFKETNTSDQPNL